MTNNVLWGGSEYVPDYDWYPYQFTELGVEHMPYMEDLIRDARLSSYKPRFTLFERINIPFMLVNDDFFGYLLIDTDKNIPIGYGHLQVMSLESRQHIADLGLYIREYYQCKGYGYIFMQFLLTEARINSRFKDVDKISLGVYGSNEKAINLYKKFGFKIEGTLKNEDYVDIKYEDVILMAKFLGGGIQKVIDISFYFC